MKKIASVFLTFAALVTASILSSCSRAPDPVQADLKTYSENMASLLKTEDAAWAAYRSEVGANFKSDAALGRALRKDVIPRMKLFQKQIALLRPRTNAVSGLGRLYATKTALHLEGFELLLAAANRHDKALVDQANSFIHRGDLYYLKWERRLQELKDAK